MQTPQLMRPISITTRQIHHPRLRRQSQSLPRTPTSYFPPTRPLPFPPVSLPMWMRVLPRMVHLLPIQPFSFPPMTRTVRRRILPPMVRLPPTPPRPSPPMRAPARPRALTPTPSSPFPPMETAELLRLRRPFPFPPMETFRLLGLRRPTVRPFSAMRAPGQAVSLPSPRSHSPPVIRTQTVRRRHLPARLPRGRRRPLTRNRRARRSCALADVFLPRALPPAVGEPRAPPRPHTETFNYLNQPPPPAPPPAPATALPIGARLRAWWAGFQREHGQKETRDALLQTAGNTLLFIAAALAIPKAAEFVDSLH
jgi:hypothetical protein